MATLHLVTFIAPPPAPAQACSPSLALLQPPEPAAAAPPRLPVNTNPPLPARPPPAAAILHSQPTPSQVQVLLPPPTTSTTRRCTAKTTAALTSRFNPSTPPLSRSSNRQTTIAFQKWTQERRTRPQARDIPTPRRENGKKAQVALHLPLTPMRPTCLEPVRRTLVADARESCRLTFTSSSHSVHQQPLATTLVSTPSPASTRSAF